MQPAWELTLAMFEVGSVLQAGYANRCGMEIDPTLMLCMWFDRSSALIRVVKVDVPMPCTDHQL